MIEVYANIKYTDLAFMQCRSIYIWHRMHILFIHHSFCYCCVCYLFLHLFLFFPRRHLHHTARHGIIYIANCFWLLALLSQQQHRQRQPKKSSNKTNIVHTDSISKFPVILLLILLHNGMLCRCYRWKISIHQKYIE